MYRGLPSLKTTSFYLSSYQLLIAAHKRWNLTPSFPLWWIWSDLGWNGPCAPLTTTIKSDVWLPLSVPMTRFPCSYPYLALAFPLLHLPQWFPSLGRRGMWQRCPARAELPKVSSSQHLGQCWVSCPFSVKCTFHQTYEIYLWGCLPSSLSSTSLFHPYSMGLHLLLEPLPSIVCLLFFL